MSHKITDTLLNGKPTLLSVVEAWHDKDEHRMMCLARCECGAEKVLELRHVQSLVTRSCGCLKAKVASIFHTRHGTDKVVEVKTWKSMHHRCSNPKNKQFHRYGGRGITVCKRWDSFEAFYADMGKRPDGMSLDRIDNDKGYSPENCRWATNTVQQRNRSNNTPITFRGKTQLLTDWSVETGLSRGTIALRLKRGWSAEKALTAPCRKVSSWAERRAKAGIR